MAKLHADIRESLTEYELPDIVSALIELHGRALVTEALQTDAPRPSLNSQD